MKQVKILLINLVSSKDRLEEQKKQFNQLGLKFELFPATSIHDFSEEQYLDLAFNGQRPLKQSELACFLSHKRAWSYVVEQNEPCVILEDDAVLVSDFLEILKQVKSLNTSIDFINLEVHGRRKIVSKQPIYELQSYKLFKLYQDRSGTGGYILYPEGARKLLSFLNQRAIGLADEFIYNCHALNAYQIEPAAVLQSDKCPMYKVETDIDMGSVIGAVKNSVNFQLTRSQKIRFKRNRIAAQLYLGIYYLKVIFKGVKREIQVDSSNFN